MRIIKVLESGNETASYTYDANGNKASETLANGVVSTYSYNNANRITKLATKSGETTISEYEYSYYLDGSDSCKIRKENGIIETTSYEYDGLKRLTQETISKGSTVVDTYSYEYDDYGNRSKMTASGTADYTTVYDYNDADGNYTTLLQKEIKTVESEAETTSASVLASNPAELLNTVSSGSETEKTVYTYDANGNQITKETSEKTETYTYDGLNQLIGFTDGDIAASYAYNVSGLRIEKTVDGETINHVWDGSKQIIADVVDNDFYEADCYLRGTNLVAKYNYCNGVKSEYTYYTQNAHGDIVNLTDETGAVTKSYTYDAFGVEQNIDDTDANVFRYCGEYFDAETGTVYLRARYYDPSIGRFISRDSYAGKNEDPLSLNRYTYCYNNPIMYADPSGHFAIAGTALLIGVAAFACVAAATYFSTPAGQETLSNAVNGISSVVRTVKSTVERWKINASAQIAVGVHRGLTFAQEKIDEVVTDVAVEVSTASKSSTKKQKPNQDVYLLFDPNTKQIEYVGRTNDWKVREQQHLNSNNRGYLRMEVIAEDISYEAARGLEQLGIEYYNTYNPYRFGGTNYNNQINGIFALHPLRADYLIAAIPYTSNLETIKTKNRNKVILTARD